MTNPNAITSVRARLAAAGVSLPAVSAHGLYASAVQQGQWLFTAGFASRTDERVITASSTEAVDIEHLRTAARVSALRAIAAIAQSVDLDTVARIVRVTGFVAVAGELRDHSRVMDAASEMFEIAFGRDRGRHARTAVGVSSLPGGAAVEIQVDAFVQCPAIVMPETQP